MVSLCKSNTFSGIEKDYLLLSPSEKHMLFSQRINRLFEPIRIKIGQEEFSSFQRIDKSGRAGVYSPCKPSSLILISEDPERAASENRRKPRVDEVSVA